MVISIDVVDRKTKLILGIVWTVILRYQIQKIEHEGGEGSVNAELLGWINKAIPAYKIKNFNAEYVYLSISYLYSKPQLIFLLSYLYLDLDLFLMVLILVGKTGKLFARSWIT